MTTTDPTAGEREFTLPPLHGGYRPRVKATRTPVSPPIAPGGSGAASHKIDRSDDR